MKLKVQKADLIKGLRLISAVAEKRSTLEVLASTLLRATKSDGLFLGATDLTISGLATLPAEVKTEGDIVVPARQMQDVVRALPGETVTLTMRDNLRIVVASDRSSYTLPGTEARNFPALPDASEDAASVDAPAVEALLKSTAFAVSRGDDRPNLANLYFECKNGTALAVGLDGHRMAKAERELPGAPECAGIMIPRKGVQEILGLVDGREPPVGLSIGSKTVAVRADNLGLWAKLSEARPLPWKDAVPPIADDTTVATVGRSMLLDAIKRAMLMTMNDRGMKLSIGGGLVKIEASSPTAGDAVEEVEAETVGEPQSTRGSGNYFIEWLGACTSDRIKVALPGERDPIVLMPADGPDHLGLVMPMRLEQG